MDLVASAAWSTEQLGNQRNEPPKRQERQEGKHHIHVGSKAAWHPITDALPQFEELPP
jgi:hypothetical protein